MSLTFAELRKQNLLRVALNTSRFAEKVTFVRQGGGEREIIVTIDNPPMSLNESGQEIKTVETIRVRVAMDEDAQDGDTVIGGIADPRLGDCIIRSGDPPSRAYSFVTTAGSTGESWFLIFQRQRREQVGTSNTRQRLA
jgi:hypothetical protein